MNLAFPRGPADFLRHTACCSRHISELPAHIPTDPHTHCHLLLMISCVLSPLNLRQKPLCLDPSSPCIMPSAVSPSETDIDQQWQFFINRFQWPESTETVILTEAICLSLPSGNTKGH